MVNCHKCDKLTIIYNYYQLILIYIKCQISAKWYLLVIYFVDSFYNVLLNLIIINGINGIKCIYNLLVDGPVVVDNSILAMLYFS